MAKSNLKLDVRALRNRLGLSQAELAKAIDATERSVRRWEKEGFTPQPWHVKAMKKLERDKFEGTSVERPVTAAGLPNRRRLPASSEGTGKLEHIGIAPSSY